ncbi:estrogen sulfotransferase [Penaeus vannamei]|uniref:Estrogen sulfotransferase n=1 Tax=Penaeus vannamei TaxID=6689 RepID=A0A423U7P3_PENVA|nr:estrogen sulfotransferase [Penaeus vannamei]
MALKLPVTVKDLPEERVQQRKAQGLNPLQAIVYTEPGDVLLPEPYKRAAEKLYNFKYRSDDIVVTTYPKSGTLWTMELVWAMTHLDQFQLPQKKHTNERVQAELAKVRPGPIDEECLTLQLAEAATAPRIIWTHLPLKLLHPDLLNTCKVVYVARNPKDICVSFYHFLMELKGRFFSGTFENVLDAFIADNLLYGPYWDHIRQARQQKDNPNFHMMFYEDMKTDILQELRKLSTFLGLQLDDAMLLKIADYAHFDRMKSNSELRPKLLRRQPLRGQAGRRLGPDRDPGGRGQDGPLDSRERQRLGLYLQIPMNGMRPCLPSRRASRESWPRCVWWAAPVTSSGSLGLLVSASLPGGRS